MFSSCSYAFSVVTDPLAHTSFSHGAEHWHSLKRDVRLRPAPGTAAPRRPAGHGASSIPRPHCPHLLAFIPKTTSPHAAGRWTLTSAPPTHTPSTNLYYSDPFISKETRFSSPSLHRSNSPRESDRTCLGHMLRSEPVTGARR